MEDTSKEPATTFAAIILARQDSVLRPRRSPLETRPLTRDPHRDACRRHPVNEHPVDLAMFLENRAMAYHRFGVRGSARGGNEHHGYWTSTPVRTKALPAAGRATRLAVRLCGGSGGAAPRQATIVRDRPLGGGPR